MAGFLPLCRWISQFDPKKDFQALKVIKISKYLPVEIIHTNHSTVALYGGLWLVNNILFLSRWHFEMHVPLFIFSKWVIKNSYILSLFIPPWIFLSFNLSNFQTTEGARRPTQGKYCTRWEPSGFFSAARHCLWILSIYILIMRLCGQAQKDNILSPQYPDSVLGGPTLLSWKFTAFYWKRAPFYAVKDCFIIVTRRKMQWKALYAGTLEAYLVYGHKKHLVTAQVHPSSTFLCSSHSLCCLNIHSGSVMKWCSCGLRDNDSHGRLEILHQIPPCTQEAAADETALQILPRTGGVSS